MTESFTHEGTRHKAFRTRDFPVLSPPSRYLMTGPLAGIFQTVLAPPPGVGFLCLFIPCISQFYPVGVGGWTSAPQEE